MRSQKLASDENAFFCNGKNTEILNLIGRRAVDLEMYRNLSRENELELNLQLKKLIKDEMIIIEEIENYDKTPMN